MSGRCPVAWPGAARAWRVMVLLALIGMALSSLGGALAAGQADPPPITQEEADQADQPALETAEPAQTQPANTGEATAPPLAPTELPGGQQVNQPPVGRESATPPFFLQLIKRVCPAKAGFVPERAPYAELDDGCRLEVLDPASFFFIVTDANGEQHVVNDIAAFFELPAGRTRAAERHAGGYGDPVVWCSFGKGEPPQRMEVIERGVTLDPKPEMLVTCEFFNPQLPPDGGKDGSITVLKVACPAGYDATSGKADPTVDCTKPLDDVGFGLTPADPDVGRQKGRTGDDGRGIVTFEGLPAGSYTIQENLPEGFAEAVVWACTDDPRQQQRFDGPLATGTRLEVELAAGQELWCLWLNVPGKLPAEPAPTEPAGGGADLTIYKWECPASAAGAQDLSTFIDTCQIEMPGVVFDVTSSSGTSTAVSQPNGTVFEDLPAGAIEVREEIPDGYGAPVVFCAPVHASLVPEVPVTDGTVNLTIEDGVDLACYWHNIPASGASEPLPTESVFVIDPTVAGTSVIHLETPAPTTAAVATIVPAERPGTGAVGDLIAIVTDAEGQPVGGACVAVIDAGGETVAESCDSAAWEQASLAGNGVTGFFGLPAGEYTVRLVSTPDGGTADDRDVTVVAGTSTQVMLTVETATPEPDAPEPTMPMPWTPTPEPTQASQPVRAGSITVLKVTCPAGFDVDSGNPTRECTKPTDGISFTLLAEGGESQRARTGDDGRGRVVFDGLPAGSFEIVEAAQAGTEPVVWACAAHLRDLASADGPLAEGGSVTVELSAGEDVTCLWLNVPAASGSAPGGPTIADVEGPVSSLPVTPSLPEGVIPPIVVGSVTVRAFTCGDDYQYPQSPSVEYLRAACSEPLLVNFTIADRRADGRMFYHGGLSPGSDGALTHRVNLGDVVIEQDRVRGFNTPHVYCRKPGGSDERWRYTPIDEPTTWTFMHDIHERLDEASPTLECEWFNPMLRDLDWDRRVMIERYYCLDPDLSQPLTNQCVRDVDRPTVFQVIRETWEGEPFTVEWSAFSLNVSPVKSITIREELADGFSPVVARCRVVDYGKTYTTVTDLGWLEASPQNGFTFDPIGVDNALRCDWYSIVETPGGGPAGDDNAATGSGPVVVVPVEALPMEVLPLEDGTIAVSAFACGPGLSRSATLAALRAACTEPFAGLPMYAYPGASGASAKRAGVTNASGGVAFANLDPGVIVLGQEPRSGYGHPLVYCSDADGALQERGWLYFTMRVELTEASPSRTCEWFALPLEDDAYATRIEFAVYLCEGLGSGELPTTDPGGPCIFNLSSFDLSVSGDQGWSDSRTYWYHINGKQWRVPAPPNQALTLSVDHHVMWDTDSGRVSCLVVDWADRTTVVRDLEWFEISEAGTITVPPIGTNNMMKCVWYDIVSTPRGTMALQAYDCPTATFDGGDDCPIATRGWYEVQILEDGAWRMVSKRAVSHGGDWTLPHLRPGTYRLVPIGGALCHTWTNRPANGGTFAIVAGEDTIVRAYRCTGG